jgi:hypothetical protein
MLRPVRTAIVATLCIAGGAARAAPVRTTQSDPHPGIHVETWVDAAIPARLHVVSVDLTSSEIAVFATRESERGLTTSAYATQLAAQVAINGDAFAVAGYVPRGLAIGDSNPWSTTADDAVSSVFHLRRVGERTYAEIVPPEQIVTPGDLPAGTQGAVSGRPLLVRAGVVTSQFDCNDPVTLACERAPRSALGVSADGNTLWLVAVDGWQAGSLGMTAAELAGFLDARGAAMAMALDGGGASTLVVDDALANTPSDGVERPVANHLAVKYGSLPKVQLVGLVCKHDVFGCGTDPARQIAGAQVTLDDGRQDITDPAAFYSFTGVTRRLACVTVKKTGYLSKSKCVQISNDPEYNSVALWEGVDPLDAGVPDAAPWPDASIARDGGTGDAGNPEHGPGGGCCGAGRDRPDVLLVVAVAWFLVRRRGTTG